MKLPEEQQNNIYNYLASRNFDYFPKIIDMDDDSIMFEYLDDISYDQSQRAFDINHLISLLHSKTTYYKEVDYDEYKTIYENAKEKINYIGNYYEDIIKIIESKIFECINYCK